MKMENEIHALADGVVEELYVTTGQTVEAGADLLKIG
jgi:biotin carboxyl carrier protein